MILKRLTAVALAGAGLLAIGAVANAQETKELDEIVVEGGGAGTGEGTPSPATQEIDRAELEEKQVESFEDIGRRIDAAVNVNTRNGSINLRGLEGNRVLTTIDGIRVPWLTDPRNSTQGGLNTFDFNGLSQVDITPGADSSRYGSGALGGIVQLRTLDPEDLIQDGKTYGGVVKGVYDTVDRSWRTNAAIAARANDTWLMVQGGYKRGHEVETQGTVDTYGSTRTMANPADLKQGDILVKLHQYVEGGHRFGLTGEYYKLKNDIDNRGGTTASYLPGTLKSGEESERQRISGEYRFEAPDDTSWVDYANLVGYWQKQKLNATTDGFRLPDGRAFIISGDPFFYGYPTGNYYRDNQLEQTMYGVTGDAVKAFDLGSTGHTLRFGGEIYGEKVTQFSYGEDNCPDIDWAFFPQPFGPQTCRMIHSNASDMPDVNGMTVGFFVEDDIKLGDPRFTLTPGIRFDYYDYRPKDTDSYRKNPNFDIGNLQDNSDFHVSPKLRAAFQATDELELYAQWAQGFRAPTSLELYQNFGAPGSYARLGNPDLKPETSNGFEIGANYLGENFALAGTIFNNYYRNFIDEVTIAPPGGEYPVDGITGFANLDHVHIYGAELRGEWNFAPNWRTWASFAYSHGKNTDTDEYLNSIPPFRGILGLGYAQEQWGADVSWMIAARRDDVSGTGFRTPGYGVVDTTVWWQPEQFKGLKIQAGVYNIFDQKYWNAVDVPESRSFPDDYYTEPGRSFRLTVTQTF